jgi:hypothetical protein
MACSFEAGILQRVADTAGLHVPRVIEEDHETAKHTPEKARVDESGKERNEKSVRHRASFPTGDAGDCRQVGSLSCERGSGCQRINGEALVC